MLIPPKTGAKIIILSPDKTLLFHRDNIPTIPSPDCWCSVGGGVEEGETFEQGLIREVKEETGFDLKEYFFFTKGVGALGEDVSIFVAFVDKEDENKFILGPGEGQELGWFTLDELNSLKLSSGTAQLYSQYLPLIEKMMITRSPLTP